MSELVLYNTDDGRTRLDLRIEGRTAWLTQLEIAELFQITKQNVSLYATNIFKNNGLRTGATVKESLTTAAAAEALKAIEELEKDLKRKGGKA